MERREQISSQPNWIQRYIIQREADERNLAQQSTQSIEELEDPLRSVKQHYFQIYSNEIGGRSVTPEISNSVHNTISLFVDTVANNAYHSYHSQKAWISRNTPKYAHADVQQALNRISAEVSYCEEKVIEAFVIYISENDHLSQTRLGKLLRFFKPSDKRKRFEKAFSLAKKNIRDTAMQVRDEMIIKYRP